MSSSGLVVNAMYPIFGVSPDGITNCCGCGALEVKCPYIDAKVSAFWRQARNQHSF